MKLVKDINKDSSNKLQVSDKEAEEAIKKLLTWIGEDPSREGLLDDSLLMSFTNFILERFYRTWLIIANCYFVFFSLFYCHV